MKAYKVWSRYADYSHVVFAETAQKARAYAKDWIEDFDYDSYIDIRAKRLPKCDALYKGEAEGDWCDLDLRKVLVVEYGWYCAEPERDECEVCRLCETWEDWSDEDEA